MSSFSAKISDWVAETEERIEAVFRTAVGITIDQVLDGTPVVTGYLKSSFTTSLTGFTPLVEKGTPLPQGTVEMTLAGFEMGGVVYGNFAANYATYVENGARGRKGRHMVKLAAQNWQQNVDRATQLAQGAVG